jgi:hypothetical protein
MVRKHRIALLPITLSTEYEHVALEHPHYGRRHILDRLCCSFTDSQFILGLVVIAIVAIIALVVVACLVLGRLLYVNWSPEAAYMHSSWKMESTVNQQLYRHKVECKHPLVNNAYRCSDGEASPRDVGAETVT